MDTFISAFSDRARNVRIFERTYEKDDGWDYSHKFMIEKYQKGELMQMSYFQTFREATDAMLIFFDEQ